METATRLITGFAILFTVQIVGWTTIIYFVRKWKKLEPAWSWLAVLWRFFLLTLLVTVIGIIPVIGPFCAVAATLIMLKRLSGLDLLGAFILSFCVGVSIFVFATMLGRQLGVDLLMLPDPQR